MTSTLSSACNLHVYSLCRLLNPFTEATRGPDRPHCGGGGRDGGRGGLQADGAVQETQHGGRVTGETQMSPFISIYVTFISIKNLMLNIEFLPPFVLFIVDLPYRYI